MKKGTVKWALRLGKQFVADEHCRDTGRWSRYVSGLLGRFHCNTKQEQAYQQIPHASFIWILQGGLGGVKP